MKITAVEVATDGAAEAQAMKAARHAYMDATQKAIDLQKELTAIREKILRHETNIVANEGFEGFPIDGKNAEIRKAQTQLACANFAPLVAARDRERDIEALLKNAQAEAIYAEHALRAARVTLEFMTSLNYREAAAMGGLLPERGER